MSKDSSSQSSKIWNPWLGILLAVVAFIVPEFFLGIIISIYPLLRGWNNKQITDWSTQLTNSVLWQFVFVLIGYIATLLILYFFARKYFEGFRFIGLRKPKWLDPVAGLIALPAYLLTYGIFLVVAERLFPSLNVNEKQQLGFNNVHGGPELLITFISLVVLPPIVEELIFRGFLYGSLKKLMPLWPAVIVTSLIFAAGHLPEGGSAGPLYVGAIDTFTLSLFLIYLREKTNGIYASMTLHALKNAIAFVALFALHLG